MPWQTPGNRDRGGIPRENDTGATVAPQNTSRAETAPQTQTADPGEQRHPQ